MKKKDSTLKDMIHVTLGNIVSLMSSILNGFAIPMILGPLNYGYYKIFVLYASYESLTHFGFNDGIMLSFAGKHYNELNGYKFRSNTFFFFWFQILISLLIISFCFFTSNSFYKSLFILLGINNFTLNIRSYYQNISQIVMRFNEYSIINVLQYTFLIVTVLIMWGISKLYSLKNVSFVPYVIVIILINCVLDLWYLYDYKRITFGAHYPICKSLNELKKYFISGAFVTLGYGVSVLIFNLDSQFVVKYFSTRTYGIYAFAYSMFSAGLTILLAAGPVLLPHLKRHSKAYILKRYTSNVSCILLLVYLAIIGYFPLKVFIRYLLPKYYQSLIYFRLLLPGIVITCCMTLIISNYYYALKEVKFYFYMSLFVLVISFIMDYSFYIIFHSPVELALSSTLSLVLWYFVANYFISRWYNIKSSKTLIYIVSMMILFLIISDLNNLLLGFTLYLMLYIIVSILLFKNIIGILIHRLIQFI